LPCHEAKANTGVGIHDLQHYARTPVLKTRLKKEDCLRNWTSELEEGKGEGDWSKYYRNALYIDI
jgi:hypothetical protein